MKNIIKVMPTFAVCLICVIPIQAQSISGTCGKDVIWNFEQETGTLTISGKGPMEDYFRTYHRDGTLNEVYKASWDKYKDQIKKVVIKNGVTAIGENA